MINKIKKTGIIGIFSILIATPLFSQNNENIIELINQLKKLEKETELMQKAQEKNKNFISKKIQEIANRTNLLQQKMSLLSTKKQLATFYETLKPFLKKTLTKLYHLALKLNNEYNKKEFLNYQTKVKINNETFYLINMSQFQQIYKQYLTKQKNVEKIKGIYLTALEQNTFFSLNRGIGEIVSFIKNQILNLQTTGNQSFNKTNNNFSLVSLKEINKYCDVSVNEPLKIILFKRCNFE